MAIAEILPLEPPKERLSHGWSEEDALILAGRIPLLEKPFLEWASVPLSPLHHGNGGCHCANHLQTLKSG